MEKRFKRIYLEITNLCNLSCSFCPIDQRQAKTMGLTQFQQVMDQVQPLAQQVCLHLMGEPLAHPEISGLLQYCSQISARIQLTTNGLLLKKYKELIASESSVVQVNISLQSFMDNFPKRKLESYLDDIFEFIEYMQANKPSMYINLRLWNLEESSDSDPNEEILDYVDKRLNISVNRKVDVGGRKSKKIAEQLYLHFDSRFEWPRLDLPLQGNQGRCNGLVDHIGIHADGTVVPCCLDDQKIINLGNVFESKLGDILTSQRAVKMKVGFLSGVLQEELCKRCTYINRFKK